MAAFRLKGIAIVLAAALLSLLVATIVQTPAKAAVGGPVILGGDDLTDHGSRNTTTNTNIGGWLYLEKAIANVAPLVTRPGNDGSIAALGSTDSTSTSANAGAAVHFAALANGKSVTYYDGAAAINGFFGALAGGTAKPAIVWIAGNDSNNDLDSAEGTSLLNNASSIGDFVNGGGGLISHGLEYRWLSGLLPGASTVNSGSDGDLLLTAAGQAAFPGLTNADVNAGPWHNHFEGNLGGLGVLVESTDINNLSGQNAPVIIGGAAVTLPGSITLDPPAANQLIGGTHTVTATTRNQNGALAVGAAVTFNVTAGPNAGATGTGTTDANGQASFSWPDTNGAGTDTVQASFVDADSVTRSTTATVTWGTAPPQADIGVTKTDGVTDVHTGDTVTYTIVVTNAGPGDASGVHVNDAPPAGLENTQWTCVASAGSSCAAAGSGNIHEHIDLLANGSATYSVTAQVAANASGSIVNTASVNAPSGMTDSNVANDSATDTDNVIPNVTVDAVPDHYITPRDTLLSAPPAGVLANDSITSSSTPTPLVATLLTDPSHGSVSLAGDGSFNYTPAPGYVGPDSFTYTACSGTVCDSTTVFIGVVPSVGATQLVAEPSVAEVIPGLVVRLGFEARLTNAANQPVGGVPVNFTINGSPTCTATTDADGVAKCSADVAQLLATILAFGYDATFDGSTTLAASADHAPIVRALGIGILGR